MSEEEEGSATKTILVALALALYFLGFGMGAFFLIGDKQDPEWFYGSQQDVPGQSPYSTERARIFPGTGPLPYRQRIRPQHVDGSVTETRIPHQEDAADATP